MERLRSAIIDTKVGVLFEEFGFRYLGPIDGHNITAVMAALKYAKVTPIHYDPSDYQKGKGYTPAEEDPVKYHGVSAKPKSKPQVTPEKTRTYTQVFGEKIIELATNHKNLSVITPAMREGSGLVAFLKNSLIVILM